MQNSQDDEAASLEGPTIRPALNASAVTSSESSRENVRFTPPLRVLPHTRVPSEATPEVYLLRMIGLRGARGKYASNKDYSQSKSTNIMHIRTSSKKPHFATQRF